MSDDTVFSFHFPAVARKKVTAAFDGGRITSDGGVLLLAAAERRLGIAKRLACLIGDPRNPALVTRGVDDILRARMLAIDTTCSTTRSIARTFCAMPTTSVGAGTGRRVDLAFEHGHD
jgi:hypothetical protein